MTMRDCARQRGADFQSAILKPQAGSLRHITGWKPAPRKAVWRRRLLASRKPPEFADETRSEASKTNAPATHFEHNRTSVNE